MNEKNKGKLIALLPILVFLVVYLGVALIYRDAYAMPVVVAFLVYKLMSLFRNTGILRVAFTVTAIITAYQM